jgi:hypothetical protein
MVDDANDLTVRQQATLRGVSQPADPRSAEVVGSAETALASPSGGPSTSQPTVRIGAGPEGRAEVSIRYKLGDVLGQGGMGEVLLAMDDAIGREVAVKRIRTADPSAEELSRFVREARVQGRLEHPAIVPVHDLVYDGAGKPFFVMKRLAGTDMHERLKKLRAGDVSDEAGERRKLLRAFVDVCNATHFAHEKKIIHRDLKPANVMLGDYGEVYILDWGVAHAADDVDHEIAAPSGRHDLALASGETQQGAILGTPAYMAPEQLVGDKVTPAADIYALGCILYEIVAGEPLHDRRRSIGSAFLSFDGRPSKKRPDVPPELDQIVEKAVKPDPSDRWTTARSLGDAVQGFLDGDRDVAVRKELSLHHLTIARDALARGGDEGRRDAMRAAGRALALDPTAPEAAEMVTRMMLEPPEKVPDEVEAHLAVLDTETARSHGKLAAVSVLGYLAFVPLLLWSGVRDVSYVVAFAALSLISCGQVLMLIRREKITAAPLYVNAAINALIIAIVARMVGPFVIAPTLVLVTLMAYASHPRFGRIPVLASILSASVFVPWGLEMLGILESTYRFVDGELVLSPVVHFSSAPTQVAFAMTLLSLLGVVAVLSRTLALRQREAARKLELQAWQLRQIVPVTPR